LARFAETLLFLIDPVPEKAAALATDALGPFVEQFNDRFLAGMRRKLGLSSPAADDAALIRRLFGAMHHAEADFTLTFRRLPQAAESPAEPTRWRALFAESPEFDGWLGDWLGRLSGGPPTAARRAGDLTSGGRCIY